MTIKNSRKKQLHYLKDNPTHEYIEFDQMSMEIKKQYAKINDPFLKYTNEIEKLTIIKLIIDVKINALIDYFEEYKKMEEKCLKNIKKRGMKITKEVKDKNLTEKK